MISRVSESRRAIREQAAAFVARLHSGEMSDEEEAALFSWLEISSRHRREYRIHLDLWENLELLDRDPVLMSAGEPRWRRVVSFPTRRRGIAAGLAVVAGLALLFLGIVTLSDLHPFGEDLLARYQTGVGERKSISLADGSRVTLNTDTRLLVDFGDRRRRVILDYGEAFFEVTKDVKRPFTVEIGPASVTVLGTKFNVYDAGRQITVAVDEGVVSVRPDRSLAQTQQPPVAGAGPAGPVEMQELKVKAGEVAFIAPTSRTVTTIHDDISRYDSWRTGLIKFEDVPLIEVIGEVNRYSTTKVLIEDRDITGIRISGVFHIGSLEPFLSALETTFPVNIERRSDRIILTARRRD